MTVPQLSSMKPPIMTAIQWPERSEPGRLGCRTLPILLALLVAACRDPQEPPRAQRAVPPLPRAEIVRRELPATPAGAVSAPSPPVAYASSPDPVAAEPVLDVAIDADPDIGRVPLDVFFELVVLGDGSADRVLWDFGDGSSAAGPRVSHTYSEPGTFVATVLAEDLSRGVQGTCDVIIQVDPGVP